MQPLKAKRRLAAILRPLAEKRPVYFGYHLFKLEKELSDATVENQIDDSEQEDIDEEEIKIQTSAIRRRRFRKGKALLSEKHT